MSGYRLALLGDFIPSFHVQKVKVISMHYLGFTTEYAGEKSTCLKSLVYNAQKYVSQNLEQLGLHASNRSSILQLTRVLIATSIAHMQRGKKTVHQTLENFKNSSIELRDSERRFQRYIEHEKQV